MQNSVPCADTDEKSRFSSEKEAHRNKNKERKSVSALFCLLFSPQRFMENGWWTILLEKCAQNETNHGTCKCTIWWQFRKTTFITLMHSHFWANWQGIMIESFFSEFQPKCFHALMPTGKAPSVQHSINILPFSFLDKCVLDEQVLFHYLP